MVILPMIYNRTMVEIIKILWIWSVKLVLNGQSLLIREIINIGIIIRIYLMLLLRFMGLLKRGLFCLIFLGLVLYCLILMKYSITNSLKINRIQLSRKNYNNLISQRIWLYWLLIIRFVAMEKKKIVKQSINKWAHFSQLCSSLMFLCT